MPPEGWTGEKLPHAMCCELLALFKGNYSQLARVSGLSKTTARRVLDEAEGKVYSQGLSKSTIKLLSIALAKERERKLEQ